MEQKKNNIEMPQELKQLLIDCNNDDKEIAKNAQTKLAELIEEQLIFNITKDFVKEKFEEDSILNKVFPKEIIEVN